MGSIPAQQGPDAGSAEELVAIEASEPNSPVGSPIPHEPAFEDAPDEHPTHSWGIGQFGSSGQVGEVETASMIIAGMTQAIGAVNLPVLIVERTGGRVLWASDAWTTRFGWQSHAARYVASSTELGESPLPAPGDSWQRTRSILRSDGSEDLTDLLLIGSTLSAVGDAFARADADASESSSSRMLRDTRRSKAEIVTMVAVERATTSSVVTDRTEVMSIIDSAIEDASEGSVAVLYIDLDRFKVVHDLVGNLEARRLLEVVARRLGSTVRGSDLVFRLASDEFVIVSCELEHPAMAAELAERIRVAIATLPGQTHDLALTASVGVAVSDNETSGEALLSAAETAVYLAKGRGRNRVAIHDDELRSRSQRLLTVERQLRRAIEQRDVGFAYQPVVHLASGTVLGAEALLRLGGEIGLSAVEVVAAAEHSGLMGTLGCLVLEGVHEQLDALIRDPGNDYVVMFNLSATQIADDALNETLSRLANDETIPPGRLAVEVPEVVVREQREAFLQLAKCIRPRFKLGIDGFGTSYDSLSRIDGLPIDYVKLHRSLTATIGSETENRHEMGELIAGLRSRGLTVVALGVERQDQAVVLAELGCSMAQGFLFAGAVRAGELRELISSGFAEALV